MLPTQRIHALALALALCELASCRGRPPPPPPAPTAPAAIGGSLDGHRAEDLYKAERFAEAAWIFEQILERRLPADRARAEFWLAKSYYKLNDLPRATTGFVAISRRPEHPYHTLAFPWLFQLYLESPRTEPRLLTAILSYPEAEVRAEEAYEEILPDYEMMLAEFALRRGHVGEARRRLAAVEQADGYLTRRALLIAGLIHERAGERDAAREAFERCAEDLSRRSRHLLPRPLDHWLWVEVNRGLARTGGKPDKRALR